MRDPRRNPVMTTTENTTETRESAHALAILATGDDQLED
jgi:hypothetical protein